MTILDLFTATKHGRAQSASESAATRAGLNRPEPLPSKFGPFGGLALPGSRQSIGIGAWRAKEPEQYAPPLLHSEATIEAGSAAWSIDPFDHVGPGFWELDAAVMFADIVGFTGWSERHTPFQALQLVRQVYGRLEASVLRHCGTLDRYTGDGMMAMFGTPGLGPRGATNALSCLMAIVDEFSSWNSRRQHRGDEPIPISVGLHYGPVIFGDLAADHPSEVAILGDTVNVANRLEALTREIGCIAAISVAAAAAATQGAESCSAIVSLFRNVGGRALKGRDQVVDVLAYGERDAVVQHNRVGAATGIAFCAKP
jgi:class 3 adenylate cyclase